MVWIVMQGNATELLLNILIRSKTIILLCSKKCMRIEVVPAVRKKTEASGASKMLVNHLKECMASNPRRK
jgi:hypothetical protein